MVKLKNLLTYILFISVLSYHSFAQNTISASHDKTSIKIADNAFQIITSLVSTKYKSFPYTIDAGKGIFETDCVGFVTHLLKQTAPKHLAFIPFEEGKLYHTIADYYNYFGGVQKGSIRADSSYWQIVDKLTDAKRGDILIWVDDESFPNSSTSHILVLGDAPKLQSDNSYEAIVYDASERTYNKDIRKSNGVGYGYIRFQTDANNVLTQYQLKISELFHKSNFVIARAM